MKASIVGMALLGSLGLLVFSVRDMPPVAAIPGAPPCADSVRLAGERGVFGDQDQDGRLRLDRGRPVSSKAEIVSAWERRQHSISSFQFAWSERQCHWQGWVPNPRYPERERLAIPTLMLDRPYTVAKSLAVEGNMMRYGFELDRPEEPDGVDVVSPDGRTGGLGVRRHYSYLNVFDGRRSTVRVASLTGSPPATAQRIDSNVDAQNLDARAILLAFRPLDNVMGSLLFERAVTNLARTFHRGRSIFLLEERHDPTGWKTILWIEPEHEFLVSRFTVAFEQKWIVDMEIDYSQDARWGWVPSGWRVTELAADGSRRLVSEAAVSSYAINQPIPADRFR
jgi:hypothetical protein